VQKACFLRETGFFAARAAYPRIYQLRGVYVYTKEDTMRTRAKILVIDDEEEICRFTKSILERTGAYEAFTSSNSADALRLVKEIHPDLILLDINMPELDGGHIAGELRENDSTKNIPIIFVTALVTKEEEGKDDHYTYLAKPVTPALLIEAIESRLYAHKTA
jgi:CheY-like chemotaxis protein